MMELNDRQRQIVEMIRGSGLLSINALSSHFGVATQTIRRDINALCEQGVARRVHGGVAPPSNPVNLTFSARRILNEEAKRSIGQCAAARISDGSTVLLGIGTTVQYVAEALLDKSNLTIVTNNLEVARLLCSGTDHDVHLVGGQLRAEDRDVAGPATLRGFSGFLADFALIGAGGLDAVHGVLDFKHFDAEIGRVLLDHARHNILVADQSKWAKTAKCTVAGWGRLDSFVTDRLPEAEATGMPVFPDDVELIEACSGP
ncbi:MAG: DeoR/GlpR family DNA-binding transcription regulator [Ruegeria sp.]